MSPVTFPVASDSSMCPGVDSASKNEYQNKAGGKDGRCVRLTTYHLHVPIVKKSGSLSLLQPCWPVQACNGTALPLPFTHFCKRLSQPHSHSAVRRTMSMKNSSNISGNRTRDLPVYRAVEHEGSEFFVESISSYIITIINITIH